MTSPSDVPIGSRWRHYTGYAVEVTAHATDERDGTRVVVYRDVLSGESFIRPMHSWRSLVAGPGMRAGMERFTKEVTHDAG